jgi:hypothetical protein
MLAGPGLKGLFYASKPVPTGVTFTSAALTRPSDATDGTNALIAESNTRVEQRTSFFAGTIAVSGLGHRPHRSVAGNNQPTELSDSPGSIFSELILTQREFLGS